jgi:hypothetical protein
MRIQESVKVGVEGVQVYSIVTNTVTQTENQEEE